MAYVDSRIPSGNQTERRWERIKLALNEQDGGMELAEAERILESRRSRGLFLEHMDEVVAAIKCLAEPDEEVVVDDPPPALEADDDPPPPQPVQAEAEEETPQPQPVQEETPMPQQASVTQNYKVYWHGGIAASSNVDWRISENDHWESDIIVRLEIPLDLGQNGPKFCVLGYAYEGPNQSQRGHVRMSGMVAFGGGNSCTDGAVRSDYVTHGTMPGGHWAEYRGRIVVRDNNVLEKDLDIGKIVFGFGTDGTSPDRYADTWGRTNNVTTTHHIPTTDTVPDRAAYRLKRDTAAWPSRNGWCLGDGSSWTWKVGPTCGFVSDKRWLDRAPSIGASCNAGKTDADYLVRANATAEQWLPDHCYPTKEVLSDPVTSAETINHADNRLPVVEDDEVAYLSIRKQSGKWLYNASKPIVQRNNNHKCSYGHIGDTHWTEREDAVYLRVRSGANDHFIEFPAGDVSGYDIADGKVVFCTRFSETRDRDYSLGTVRDQCALSNTFLKQNAVLESIWVGGWGEIKLNHDQIKFEQAGKAVNLCN